MNTIRLGLSTEFGCRAGNLCMQTFAAPPLLWAILDFSSSEVSWLETSPSGQYRACQQALGADKDNSAWQQATIAGKDSYVVPGCIYCHLYPSRLQVLQVHLHVTYIKQSATCNTWQGHASMYSTPVNAA